jgi:hypothetical protein
MDLIEDHQLALMLGKVELRLRELGSVRIGLEIEIDRRPCLGYFEREGSLADLARPISATARIVSISSAGCVSMRRLIILAIMECNS